MPNEALPTISASRKRPLRLAVRTHPFHGCDTSSILVGVATLSKRAWQAEDTLRHLPFVLLRRLLFLLPGFLRISAAVGAEAFPPVGAFGVDLGVVLDEAGFQVLEAR